MTLTAWRTLIQGLMLALTVWGAVIVGHYSAEKLSRALPALACAHDRENGAYCVLVPLQHQMHHRVGESLTQGLQLTADALLAPLLTLAAFLAFYLVLGKAFCGWVCPLGTVQEWLHRLGRRLGAPLRRLAPERARRLRWIKWAVLLTLVLGLPLVSGLGLLPHDFRDPFCQVCPSRIVSSLLTGDTTQLALRHDSVWATALGLAGNVLTGLVLVAALAWRQPFCRVCPLLALNAAFQRVGLMRLDKRAHDRCSRCGICTRACPMDIGEIASRHGRAAFVEDCTLCGRCAEFCPDDGVIRLRWGPWTWFRSARAYYRRRLRAGGPDGTPRGHRGGRRAAGEARP